MVSPRRNPCSVWFNWPTYTRITHANGYDWECVYNPTDKSIFGTRFMALLINGPLGPTLRCKFTA